MNVDAAKKGAAMGAFKFNMIIRFCCQGKPPLLAYIPKKRELGLNMGDRNGAREKISAKFRFKILKGRVSSHAMINAATDTGAFSSASVITSRTAMAGKRGIDIEIKYKVIFHLIILFVNIKAVGYFVKSAGVEISSDFVAHGLGPNFSRNGFVCIGSKEL